MGCPNPKCREDLIFQINKITKDLSCRINKKVSIPILVTISIFLIGTSGGFIIHGMRSNALAKEKVAKNTQDIAVVKKDIEHIKEAVKRIENNQLTKRELIKTIRDAIKTPCKGDE